MRLLLCALLFTAAAVPTSLSALSEAEICAKMIQDFGFDMGECVQGRKAPTPQTQTQSLDLETRESHIFFEKGGTRLSESAQLKVAALTAVLNTQIMGQACIKLVGHSDTSGNAARNFTLAQQRADIVAQLLREGIERPERIQDVTSAGETRPLPAYNGANPLNRRVEILAKTCP